MTPQAKFVADEAKAMHKRIKKLNRAMAEAKTAAERANINGLIQAEKEGWWNTVKPVINSTTGDR
jgi:hypothetical protein